MAKMIFVNLPVRDVPRATAFYEAIGFAKNATFSSEQASSMVWSDAITVMLLDRAFYATFTDKRVIDPTTESGVLLAISRDSRAEVDAMYDAAIAAGARELHGAEDHGFMYAHPFEDPDGNGWNPLHMDLAAAEAALKGEPA